jgi:hypothetical protein
MYVFGLLTLDFASIYFAPYPCHPDGYLTLMGADRGKGVNYFHSHPEKFPQIFIHPAVMVKETIPLRQDAREVITSLTELFQR